jgi:hypothetical protein
VPLRENEAFEKSLFVIRYSISISLWIGGFMRRFGSVLLGLLIVLALSAQTWAASEQAMKLRSKNALSEYSPPESFLSGNFVADEDEPAYIFGKVKDFTRSRSCTAAWLIDEGEKKRVEARGQ